MIIDEQVFYDAGKHTLDSYPTNTELEKRILVLNMIRAYLRARGDCGLLCTTFGNETEYARELLKQREMR